MIRNDFKKLNARFEDRLSQFIVSVTESELTPEKRAERRSKCDHDTMEFAKTYFGNMFELPFNDVHRWIDSLTVGKKHCQAARYYGKSTYAYIRMIIKPLCLGREGGVEGMVNLNSFKLEVANFLGSGVMRSMKRNKLLCYDYNLEFEQDKIGYWIVNGIPFITGSFRTGLRSLHDDDMIRVTYQLNDDMYGVDEASSESACEKIYNFIVDEAWGQLDQTRPALSLTLGNGINEQVPIVQLERKFPNDHFKLPACINPETGESLDPEDGGQTTWPEFRSNEDWQAFKQETDPVVWAGQYQCKPVVHGDILNVEWLKTVNINTIKIINRIAICDPAHGESPAACFKAFGVGGLTDKDQLIVLDLWVRRENYWSLFNYAHRSYNEHKFDSFLFEDDFAQWAFAEKDYKLWRAETGNVLNIVPFYAKELATGTHSSQKFDRMMNLVLPFQRGEILFDENVARSRDYETLKQQYISFGSSNAKVDAIDMLASMWIMIFRYKNYGKFRASKKRLLNFKRIFS